MERSRGGGARASSIRQSLGAAAEGDAVADGELADLDAVVCGEGLVELEDEVAVVADVLAHGGVGGEHDGSVPERVVVAEEAADPDELHEALGVVEVVVLFGVDEDEVELGTELVPNMEEAKIVCLKWKDGEVVEEKMFPWQNYQSLITNRI